MSERLGEVFLVVAVAAPRASALCHPAPPPRLAEPRAAPDRTHRSPVAPSNSDLSAAELEAPEAAKPIPPPPPALQLAVAGTHPRRPGERMVRDREQPPEGKERRSASVLQWH